MSIFMAESLTVVDKSLTEVAKKMNFQVLEINGKKDHIHTLIEFPPKLAVRRLRF